MLLTATRPTEHKLDKGSPPRTSVYRIPDTRVLGELYTEIQCNFFLEYVMPILLSVAQLG